MAAYSIVSCLDGSSWDINFDGLTPTSGQTYFIEFEGPTPMGCYTIGEEVNSWTDVFYSAVLYDDCNECWTTTYSGETSGQYTYEDCVNCSGTTTVQPLPHPIYTNGQGIPVTQLTAVALGGFNGLNS